MKLLFSVFLIGLSIVIANEGMPKPFSSANKVLSMVIAFSLNRMDPLLITMRGHQAMCEAGWDVNFVIFTAHKVSLRYRRYLEAKLYCHRIQSNIPLIISEHDPSVHIGLVEETRAYLRSHWEQYDVYIYMEEDVIVEFQHLVGYLSESLKLQNLIGKEEAMSKYHIGFQRYRRHLLPMEGKKTKMGEEEVLLQEYLEEVPFFKPVCFKDQPYMHVQGNKRVPAANVYQAMWILTREQLGVLQGKCKFLDQTFKGTPMERTGYVREYLGSLSLLENDIIGPSCGLQKIIPAGRLLDFSLWHYFYSTNQLLLQQDHPLYGTYEHIQAGMLQASTVQQYAGYFQDAPCWASIYNTQRTEFNISISTQDVALVAYGGTTYLLRDGKRHTVRRPEALKESGYGELPVGSAKHMMFDALPAGADIV